MDFLRTRTVMALLACTLLTACEIEDDLQIRADGSGTYRARVTVERVIRPILERIRAEAEREGFRIIDEGATFTSRYIVVRKDFTDIRALSGPQSNFDLKIEQGWYRRRYRLRATLGSVSGASFERRFTITMPATVKSSTAGHVDGRRVTWYCANGGSIDIEAEGVHVPPRTLAIGIGASLLLVMAVIAGVVLFVRSRGRPGTAHVTPPVASGGLVCRTCRSPIPPAAHYCPSCGDIV